MKIKLLPYEDLIKALKEKGIEYDEREIEEAYFPLEDVEACLKECQSSKISDRHLEDYTNCRPCPLCGKPSEELEWIYFESPKWTWDNMMGQAGTLSICPDCGCLVEFNCLIRN